LTLGSMRELSVAEQRYQAVLAVIADGLGVSQAAEKFGVSRQTLYAWLARSEASGLEGLVDRSHRPRGCPHQMPAVVEALVLELRRERPYWGPRRLVVELGRRGVVPLPSASSVYRALLRAGVVESSARAGRSRKWKRWERSRPMELWQMDTVGGFPLVGGRSVKALTGIDDHSRLCVSAWLMPAERTRGVCDGLVAALRTWGVPEQVLTDNGKVFTGRFNHPPTEVLFDRICRENGIEHLLTQPRSPTTTGKIERFHRSLRTEFLAQARPFASLAAAQRALDEWVSYYNCGRPHQALAMATPAERFNAGSDAQRSGPGPLTAPAMDPGEVRPHEQWISRRVAVNGVVCVAWQQISIGRVHAGERCDVLVDGDVLRLFIADQLVKTVARADTRQIRKKKASVPGGRT
jgi:transposase InsO family protein